ncbi:hypothetical protein C483_00914 [Natrialba hulunbeirensis JCM 10989]|uniref:Uncharacterized protein n=1 Tax=Natrialba hulunbeirensis JCM 10989 TaxID=1227493 RepID=M0ACR5_9EURY|nr:hypothetical protein [Natrialba hulunbeirensis]ELY95662.1 hypothetical protein C483_00914 [Natrialba hulunbeirensis JCM 10989]
MKAVIGGEDEDGVGLRVIDNDDVSHGIHVAFNGEIKYHEQDGYSDYPSERTQAENEHVRQARRFAKWHVYREQGYETMPRHENPDCLVAAMIALSALSEDAIADRFGDLRSQLESHYNGSSVQLPFEDADPDDVLIYRKDLTLSPDPLAVEPPLADQYAALVTAIQDEAEAVLTDSDDIEQQLLELFNYEDRLEAELPSFDLETVSEMHYLHTDGKSEQTKGAKSSLDREADARIELPPIDLDSFSLYRLLLVANLSSQIRDRYLMMGEEPPEAFQHQGFGTYRGTVKQEIHEIYDRYYLFTESVNTWSSTPF